MKQIILNKLEGILSSPHTSGSALVLFALTVAGYIWPKCADTLQKIANAAILYGLVMAGDAKPTAPPAQKGIYIHCYPKDASFYPDSLI